MPRPRSFNGAALFRARRFAPSASFPWMIALLQRGRALSSAEMTPLGPSEGSHGVASTGPRSFERGDVGGRTVGDCRRPASTGPRSFERGDLGTDAESLSTRAVLQRGRALSSAEIGRESLDLTDDNLASTGPRSFERGDVICPAQRVAGISWLQRGRALSSAEITRTRLLVFFIESLQRGRALSSAEIASVIVNLRTLGNASTGPRSFERGDQLRRDMSGCLSFRFNGAALFRARRFQQQIGQVIQNYRASTGPRSFERGDFPWLRCLHPVRQ